MSARLGRGRVGPVVVAALLASAWTFAFPAWPDDWDGLGFLASVTRFDLATFAPHPPGYPVYVALLKIAACLTGTALGAARVVAVASGVVTFAALSIVRWPFASAAWTRGEQVTVAAACCLTPLASRAFSGVGSEGPALACAALAFAGLSPRPPLDGARARLLLVGLGVGLGLGVRLSWAPFYGALLVLVARQLRVRAAAVAAGVTAIWAAALVAATGPGPILSLFRTHLLGHFTRWGGTAITEPSRAQFLARDVVVDGLGCGGDLLGVAIASCLVACVAWALWSLRSSPVRAAGHRLLAGVAVLVTPYLAWVGLGQNLREQPRHVLPLVLLLTTALGAVLAARPSRAGRALFVSLAVLVATRTTIDVAARRSTPPSGWQLLTYLRGHADPASTAVFAGPSGRFFDGTEWRGSVHPAASVDDALLAVTHLDALPAHLYVTSELTSREELRLSRVATFCRPPRLDRRVPCLDLSEVDLGQALGR